jgi:hypothetical protein
MIGCEFETSAEEEAARRFVPAIGSSLSLTRRFQMVSRK